MPTPPRAVARLTPLGQPAQETLKNFTVGNLRALYAPYTPNSRLLGEVDVLQQRRAHYMIEWLRPILWQSPEGAYLPIGYVYDTARLLSLLDATTLVTTIIQVSDTCPGPYPLHLQDELQWNKRNITEMEASISRRKHFAEAHGDQYKTHKMIAEEIGITEASFSRKLRHA